MTTKSSDDMPFTYRGIGVDVGDGVLVDVGLGVGVIVAVGDGDDSVPGGAKPGRARDVWRKVEAL